MQKKLEVLRKWELVSSRYFSEIQKMVEEKVECPEMN